MTRSAVRSARTLAAAALALATLQRCASAPPPTTAPSNTAARGTSQDMVHGLEAVGSESDVVVKALIYSGNDLSTSSIVTIVYEVENRRQVPIAVADIAPNTTYDAQARTLVVEVGSEVPGTELLPRLVKIDPGQKQKFTVAAHMNVPIPYQGALLATPRQLQIKVNFLDDLKPFGQLVELPQKAVRDKALADELFPKWVERNEAVALNALPVHWVAFAEPSAAETTSADQSGRVPRGRP